MLIPKIIYLRGVCCKVNEERHTPEHVFGMVYTFPDMKYWEKMVRATAFILSVLLPGPLYAGDCFERAGRDYRIDPDLIRAVAWNESHFRNSVTGRNPVSGYGSGLMQIDSQHFPELKKYGISPQRLLHDPCLNVYTGTYYLAKAFQKWGVNWQAVGAYNAGFQHSARQAMRRYAYARRVARTYRVIKTMRPGDAK